MHCFSLINGPKIIEAMKHIARIHLAMLLFALLIVSFLFSACKTQAEPQIDSPASQLIFTGMRADNPMELLLNFLLQISPPGPSAEMTELESWQVVINGAEASSAFRVDKEGSLIHLKMDMAALVAGGLAPQDNYEVSLTLNLSYGPDSQERIVVSGLAAFPGVREPEFSISSIAILKAELVNTRFRVAIRIVNRNPFPVELSAFRYELYGNGRFWADGAERDIVVIPGMSAVEGRLFLPMNFIDMDRNLLDQIINLVDVNYRFTGEMQVSTGIEYIPRFSSSFDLSGYSQVLDD